MLRRLRLLAVAAPRTGNGTGVSNPGRRAGILARPNHVERTALQNLNLTIYIHFSKSLYLERVQINRSERFRRASQPFPRRAHSASLHEKQLGAALQGRPSFWDTSRDIFRRPASLGVSLCRAGPPDTGQWHGQSLTPGSGSAQLGSSKFRVSPAVLRYARPGTIPPAAGS